MGGSISGNFGNTKGSSLDALSNMLAAASLIPGLDTFTNLASIPVDLARGDFVSAGLSAAGMVPFIGEVADTAKLAKMADKAVDAAKTLDKASDIGKTAMRSPLKIPKTATATKQAKNGYSQIKYEWRSGKYNYLSRWHTRTPNAPKNQGNSWVVERRIKGVGYGKNANPGKHEVLVGKNKWVSMSEWKKAITARKQGNATKKQIEMLNNGHWRDLK